MRHDATVRPLICWVFFTVLSGCGEGPGGMPPTYNAADFDARLTREAKTATPVIEALRRYQSEHRSFPEDASALRAYLPTSTVITGQPPNQAVAGWCYDRQEAGFTLTRKIGWDPCLRYRCFNGSNEWVFLPGDGSPDKTILLKP
jgi:hypothetical protein